MENITRLKWESKLRTAKLILYFCIHNFYLSLTATKGTVTVTFSCKLEKLINA